MKMDDVAFVIIGAAKSATTWLQRELQVDPAVFMPDPELHYFSREMKRGDEWYLAQFAGKAPNQLAGEKSNSYLNTPGCADLLHRALPTAKLVAQLRNPVDRAYSDYCMLYRRGEVSSDIASHLDPRIAKGGRFISSGHYSAQIEAYVELFGRDALLLLTYEGVRENSDKQLRIVREFIGLPSAPPTGSAAITKVKDKTVPMVSPALKRRFRWAKPIIAPLQTTSAYRSLHREVAREIKYPDFHPDLRSRLEHHYTREIEAMEKLMGRPLPEWKNQL